MHAKDRKPKAVQRKAAPAPGRGTSADVAGTHRPVGAGAHSPQTLRTLQRSAGNAAVVRSIEQNAARQPGQAGGPGSALPVQRAPKGPFMQGYDRPGISNAATEEMLSYQGADGAPSSPRAEQRLKELKGDNQFDTALAANWKAGKRTGQTQSGVPISRNHRLSDHYVGHVMENAAAARRKAGNDGLRVVEIDTAVKQFVTACAPSGSVDHIMDEFGRLSGGNFRDVVGAASNNGRNLRAGHSRENSTIQEHFDPGIIVGGTATPITKSIMEAVNNLAAKKVIEKSLAEEALQPYRGWTSSDVRERA